MKFSELASSLKEGLSPVYLVEGEEVYFRDHAVRLIRAACGITQPSLNDVRYEGETLKGDKLLSFLSDLSALPFFDERRLVRACEWHPTEKEWEPFEAYVKSPSPTTVLVIVNGGKKAGCAELRRKKGIVFVDCAKESEEVLQRWLFGVMRKRGLTSDGEAVSLMVRYCNLDCARMAKECDKLAVLLGEGGKVTKSAVEEYVAKDAEYKIYELTQAASRKNAAAFMEILYDMKEKGFDEYAVLSALLSHYRTLFEVSSMKGSNAEIAKALGMKSAYPVQINRETARRLGAERVQALYASLYELSCGAKSGIYAKEGALFAAVAKIFFG